MKSTATQVHIREATLSDAETIKMLLDQLGYKLSIEQFHIRIKSYANTHHKIYVAELKSKVIGVMSLGLSEQLWTDGPCCRIDSLVINENFRGQGIGKILLQIAESYALEKGCKVIDLVSEDKRKKDGTHDFYKSLGFKDHRYLGFTYFSKEL